MIAAKAGGKPYADLVQELVIEPFGLHDTFYAAGTFPPEVRARLAHGYFENHACADYLGADCAQSWNLPMIGRDIRDTSQSWAQAAGGAAASARDVDRWMRAVFSGRVVPPEQQAEWMQMISTKSGEPIDAISADDPMGFSLGLSQVLMGSSGANWFYGGITLGYRTLYVWFEEDDILVTVQTNSQPDDGVNTFNDLVLAIHAAVSDDAAP